MRRKHIGRPAGKAQTGRPFSSELKGQASLVLARLTGRPLAGRAFRGRCLLGFRRAIGRLADLLRTRLLLGCHFRGSSVSGARAFASCVGIPLGTQAGEAVLSRRREQVSNLRGFASRRSAGSLAKLCGLEQFLAQRVKASWGEIVPPDTTFGLRRLLGSEPARHYHCRTRRVPFASARWRRFPARRPGFRPAPPRATRA